MTNQFALLQSDLEVERFGETEMPRLMDKQDWKTVMFDVGAAKNVWYENVVCDTRNASCSLPGAGRYRVIFVKLADGAEFAFCGVVVVDAPPPFCYHSDCLRGGHPLNHP